MSSQTRAIHPWWASPQSHFLTALIAFSCGMTVMWLINHRAPAPPQQVIVQPQQAAPALPMPSTPANTPPVPTGPQVTSSVPEAIQAGHDFYDARRWMDAIAQYEFVIVNGGDHPNIRTNLGNCFRFIGQPEEALKQYAIAQQQDPRHEFSLFNTATIYIEVLNDLPRAVETWRVYEARFPESLSSDRVHRFLSSHPRFTAALDSAPRATPTPAATAQPSGTASPANGALQEWMRESAPLPTP